MRVRPAFDTVLPLDQFATAIIEPVLSRLRWHGITPLVELRFSSFSFPVFESMEKAVTYPGAVSLSASPSSFTA